MEIKVLYEDKYLIVVEKPPKVASQSDKTNDKDMVSIVKEYLLDRNQKNNEPYLGLVHRLDRPVGGIMIFAKNQFSNRELSEQIRTKKIKKEYYAVICGKPNMDSEFLENYLKKLRTINMSKVVAEGTKGAKKSQLKYQFVDCVNTKEYGELSLLRIKLMTGRHHQIRVQLSNKGLCIWGDNKYNKIFVKKKEWTQIALWAYKLEFIHPKTKKQMVVESMPNNDYPFSLFSIIES